MIDAAGGKVLDDAATGAVRSRRRGTSHATKVKSLTRDFLDAPAVGKGRL
jgi:hypothetical protein